MLTLDGTPSAGLGLPEVAYEDAESCRLYWGVQGCVADMCAPTGAPNEYADTTPRLFETFRPAAPSAQLGVARASCPHFWPGCGFFFIAQGPGVERHSGSGAFALITVGADPPKGTF